jgi:hypothetical protein
VEEETAEPAVALHLACLLNVAMCALKLGEFSMAEKSCSKVREPPQTPVPSPVPPVCAQIVNSVRTQGCAAPIARGARSLRRYPYPPLSGPTPPLLKDARYSHSLPRAPDDALIPSPTSPPSHPPPPHSMSHPFAVLCLLKLPAVVARSLPDSPSAPSHPLSDGPAACRRATSPMSPREVALSHPLSLTCC